MHKQWNKWDQSTFQHIVWECSKRGFETQFWLLWYGETEEPCSCMGWGGVLVLLCLHKTVFAFFNEMNELLSVNQLTQTEKGDMMSLFTMLNHGVQFYF